MLNPFSPLLFQSPPPSMGENERHYPRKFRCLADDMNKTSGCCRRVKGGRCAVLLEQISILSNGVYLRMKTICIAVEAGKFTKIKSTMRKKKNIHTYFDQFIHICIKIT